MPNVIITAARAIFRHGGQAIADKINTEAKALSALCDRYSENHDNREAIAACASRILLQADGLEGLSGDDPAVLEERRALQEYRLRLGSMVREVRMYTLQLCSNEEGSKTALKRITFALGEMFAAAEGFREREDDRSPIAAAVIKVRSLVKDFAVIEPGMQWNVGLAAKACDTLLWLLDQEVPTTTVQAPTVERNINGQRDVISRELGELYSRLICIGGHDSGGLVERVPIIAKLQRVQRTVDADMYSNLPDPDALIATLREIPNDIHAMRNAPSPVTGEPSPRNTVALPAIVAQIEKVVRLLGSAPHPAQRSIVPVTSPRQVASRVMRPAHANAEWAS